MLCLDKILFFAFLARSLSLSARIQTHLSDQIDVYIHNGWLKSSYRKRKTITLFKRLDSYVNEYQCHRTLFLSPTSRRAIGEYIHPSRSDFSMILVCFCNKRYESKNLLIKRERKSRINHLEYETLVRSLYNSLGNHAGNNNDIDRSLCEVLLQILADSLNMINKPSNDAYR